MREVINFMTTDMDFLKKRLSEKPASILLGAGFSYGAKNKGGNILQLGSGLSTKLYEHFFWIIQSITTATT